MGIRRFHVEDYDPVTGDGGFLRVKLATMPSSCTIYFDDIKAHHDNLQGSPEERRVATRQWMLSLIAAKYGEELTARCIHQLDFDPATGAACIDGFLA